MPKWRPFCPGGDELSSYAATSVNQLKSPIKYQAITWTNTNVLTIGPLLDQTSNQNRNITTFFRENAFENVICKMAAILLGPHCVNKYLISILKCQAEGKNF